MDCFEWDEQNVEHIAHHDVLPVEVEEVFSRPVIVEKSAKVKGRFEAYGTTASRRYLVVVFVHRPGRIRTITAFPMNPSTRRKYAPKLKAKDI